MLVVPNAISLEVLAALVGTGAVLDGVIVHLYQNDLSPLLSSVLADFTEADFTGYAASTAVVWGAPFLDPDQVPSVQGGSKQFTASDPLTTTNTVYGYYVTDDPPTKLIYAERFASPINVAAPFDAVVVVPVFSTISQSP